MFFIVTSDMEVPEQSNVSDNTADSESISSISANNQQNSVEYVMPSVRHRSQQQQQQLLLVNKICSYFIKQKAICITIN